MEARRVRAMVLVAVAGLLLAVTVAPAGAGAGARSPAAATMRYACAGQALGTEGVLHFIRRPSRCKASGEVLLDFRKDAPVSVCRKQHGAAGVQAKRRAPAGSVRLVDDPRRCGAEGQSNESARSLARTSRTRFCAADAGGALRWVGARTRCGRAEFAVLLPKRGRGRARTRAADDAATADEDHAITINVGANDRAGSARRRLRSVTPASGRAKGALSITSSRKVRYDPAGKFDGLKPGQSATDRFSYRVSDGAHAARATVTVRLTGVDDAPRAADRTASVDENSSGPVSVDVVGSASDPEGDAPLALDTFDHASEGGAAVSARNGWLVLDPDGAFETLGTGQTRIDTLRYTVKDPAGARSDAATLAVTVAGENDSPKLAGIEEAALTVSSGGIAAPATNRVSETLALSDVDRNDGPGGRQMTGATLRITRGVDIAHHDTLAFTPTDGISGSYDASSGVLALTGAAPTAAYEQALRSVTFRTDIAAPASDRTVSFRVDDGGPADNLSNAATRDVHVTSGVPSIAVQPALSLGYSPQVSDYVVRCTSGEPLQVAVDAPDGTQVAVDGQEARGGSFQATVELEPNQGFAFVVSRGAESQTNHVRCLPGDFPDYDAAATGQAQAQWYFVSPVKRQAGLYAIAFDNHGVPVWWKAAPAALYDFKLLENGNVGWFSTWFGGLPMGFNEFTLDGTRVRSTTTVGAPTDFHDYQELPGGNRYLMSYKARHHVDVSAYTGKPEDTDASVTDAEFQEIAPDGTVVWSWNSRDHVDLSETGRWWQLAAVTKTDDGRNLYDIVHANSIEPDGDGVIVSLRHTDALYRIDKATGDIDWKLGGLETPDSLAIAVDDANAGKEFGGQHDARRLPDGTISLMDNGTARNRPPRALRFAVDEAAGTATLVESLTDPQESVSTCCGSARKLPGGNWVVDWGGVAPHIVTELTPDGDRPFRLSFPDDFSYRANEVLPGVLSAADLRAGMEAQHPRP